MGLITEPDVESFPVRLRKNHDRGDAEIPTGPNDPDRDLPAIGDQNFFKHWTFVHLQTTDHRPQTIDPKPNQICQPSVA